MAEMSARAAERLRMLRVTYVEQLPQKMAQIDDAWKSLKDNGMTRDGLVSLSLMAHSIAGSGATFGFPVLSEEGRRLELCLDELTETGAELSGDDRVRVEMLLEDLRIACQDVTA